MSELLVNNVTRDCDTIMATGKLLLLMTTAINEKPRKHCRSLNERIKIARNLLNCYFELIKSEGKNKLPYVHGKKFWRAIEKSTI